MTSVTTTSSLNFLFSQLTIETPSRLLAGHDRFIPDKMTTPAPQRPTFRRPTNVDIADNLFRTHITHTDYPEIQPPVKNLQAFHDPRKYVKASTRNTSRMTHGYINWTPNSFAVTGGSRDPRWYRIFKFVSFFLMLVATLLIAEGVYEYHGEELIGHGREVIGQGKGVIESFNKGWNENRARRESTLGVAPSPRADSEYGLSLEFPSARYSAPKITSFKGHDPKALSPGAHTSAPAQERVDADTKEEKKVDVAETSTSEAAAWVTLPPGVHSVLNWFQSVAVKIEGAITKEEETSTSDSRAPVRAKLPGVGWPAWRKYITKDESYKEVPSTSTEAIIDPPVFTTTQLVAGSDNAYDFSTKIWQNLFGKDSTKKTEPAEFTSSGRPRRNSNAKTSSEHLTPREQRKKARQEHADAKGAEKAETKPGQTRSNSGSLSIDKATTVFPGIAKSKEEAAETEILKLMPKLADYHMPSEASSSEDSSDQGNDDLFSRLHEVGSKLYEPLFDYEPLTDLANKVRLAGEVFYKAEISNAHSNATLAEHNAKAKAALKSVENALKDVDFLPRIHGNSVFADNPKRLRAAMSKFATSSAEKQKENVHALWLHYRDHLNKYYDFAKEWSEKIDTVKDAVSSLGFLHVISPLIDMNTEELGKTRKGTTPGQKRKDQAKRDAQKALLQAIEVQAKEVHDSLGTAGKKLKEVLKQKVVDDTRFGEWKEDLVKVTKEHLAKLEGLERETKERFKKATNVFKVLTANGRLRAGAHPEL